MTYDKGSLAAIVLDSLVGLEYKHKIKLLQSVRDPKELFCLPVDADEYLSSVLGQAKANTVRTALKDADYHRYVIEGLNEKGTKCIPITDENDYPFLLRNSHLPPFVLYCNGNTDLLKTEYPFAIVGSRKCLPNYNAYAENYAKDLSLAGATIVTGCAGGADTAAIKGALDTGRIISVIAGGIDHIYPEYSKSLVKNIVENGLVVSEYPPDYSVKPWMFPMRNRIIAGLSKGVLIVGGDLDSGARYTAASAVEYGREVFAFPYSLGIKSGELNNSLIKSGAAICTELKDVTDFLGIKTQKEEQTDLSGDLKEVYELIKSGVDETFRLVERTEIPVFELSAILSELEIDGLIVKLSGNKYKTVK